jgi:hypothetical protein
MNSRILYTRCTCSLLSRSTRSAGQPLLDEEEDEGLVVRASSEESSRVTIRWLRNRLDDEGSVVTSWRSEEILLSKIELLDDEEDEELFC